MCLALCHCLGCTAFPCSRTSLLLSRFKTWLYVLGMCIPVYLGVREMTAFLMFFNVIYCVLRLLVAVAQMVSSFCHMDSRD